MIYFFGALKIRAFLLHLSSFAISLNPPRQEASRKWNDMLKPSQLLPFQRNLSELELLVRVKLNQQGLFHIFSMLEIIV